MKKGIITISSAAVLSMAGWCGMSSCTVQAEEKITVNANKVLIAYYSWSGNTRIAAETVAAATGGTLVEIKPVTPYPSDYDECVEQAKKEIKEKVHPAITVDPHVNIADYDVILIGSPNWWSSIAPPVSTFIASSDLKTKSVGTFVTHGGGGMAHCEKDATALAKGARILKGAAFAGSSVERNKEQIAEWVHSILSIKK